MSLLSSTTATVKKLNELVILFSRARAPADLVERLKHARNGLRAAVDDEEKTLADLASAFQGEVQDSGRIPVADAVWEGDQDA